MLAIPLFHFTSVTGRDMDADLCLHSEEHLQMDPKPSAVLGRCCSDAQCWEV